MSCRSVSTGGNDDYENHDHVMEVMMREYDVDDANGDSWSGPKRAVLLKWDQTTGKHVCYYINASNGQVQVWKTLNRVNPSGGRKKKRKKRIEVILPSKKKKEKKKRKKEEEKKRGQDALKSSQKLLKQGCSQIITKTDKTNLLPLYCNCYQFVGEQT